MTRKLLLYLFSLFSAVATAQVKFETYFEHKTLRIDYLMGGDFDSETVFLKELKQEPHWGGNKNNLTDKFGYGAYRFSLLDSATNFLLYSKGFNSLFQEWQTTAEARKLDRAYYQVNVMPFPKQPVVFVLEKRTWEGEMKEIFRLDIDPNNYFIQREEATPFKYQKILGDNMPDKAVDVAFIAEGYSKEQMPKFRKDAQRIAENILSFEPFKSRRADFNFYAIEAISSESGTDIPGKGIYKNTACNFSFFTFDSERYLTTSDLKSLHDYAALVPYDHIYVIVNTQKYGGGGFYNYYCSTMSDHELTPNVATHEFGHSFAGLADEYYTPSIAYGDFYNLKVEPWEPNITTLVNFKAKWKSLLEESIPIPTERKEENKNKLGVYEGGGYSAKGIYSPVMNCMMKTNEIKHFCPVCHKAIEDMIDFTIGK